MPIAIIMAIAMGCDLAVQKYAHFTSPGLFLLPAIAVTGMLGGLTAALVGAGISVTFAAVVYTHDGPIFQPPYDHLLRL